MGANSPGNTRRLRRASVLAACLCAVFLSFAAEERRCRVEFFVYEEDSDAPLPCRIQLQDAKDEYQQADHLPFYRYHTSSHGLAAFHVGPGDYSYTVERGPEYKRVQGSFSLTDETLHKIVLRLERRVDMKAEGWWSGELHVHRPLGDIELLATSEDLHICPVITWWNARSEWPDGSDYGELLSNFDSDRFCYSMAGEDERAGGAYMFFGLGEPLDIRGAEREYPSPIAYLKQAKEKPGAWIDIEKPFWWDAPVALALGLGDSIGVANNHMMYGGMLDNEAWGRRRDTSKYPSPRGNGLWTQDLYYHILNAGLRIPPSAGSASGVLTNHVGYNRAYVHLEGALSYEKWWQGLRAGRVFVTNGPLLRTTVNGYPPGHVFQAAPGTALDLPVQSTLHSNDPISKVEIVKNGSVVQSVSAAELQRAGTPGSVHFERSGWFLVRTIADVDHTFRFASTGPYYVEIGSERSHISRQAARFFLDWVRERKTRIKIDDPRKLAEVLQYHDQALAFWQERLARANAE